MRNLKFKFFIFFIIIKFFICHPASAAFFISESGEINLGKEADKEIMRVYELYPDKDLQTYVNLVGQRLVSNISDPLFSKYYFKVVDSSEINAFATAGGYVYITSGILSILNSEAEMAGVLAHEIGHITSHHLSKQRTKATAAIIAIFGGIIGSQTVRENSYEWLVFTNELFTQVLLGYGREAELEADALGLIYMHSANYDPRQMVKFLKNLKQQEQSEGGGYHGFHATHPETQERIIKSGDMSESLSSRGKGKLLIETDNYKLHLEGLKVGGKRNIRDDHPSPGQKHLTIYTVKEGDTLKTISRDFFENETMAFRIARLNGIKEDAVLTAGEKLKIAVEKENKFNKPAKTY